MAPWDAPRDCTRFLFVQCDVRGEACRPSVLLPCGCALIFGEDLWIFVALGCITNAAGLIHGDEQLPLALVNQCFLVQLSQKGKEVKN